MKNNTKQCRKTEGFLYEMPKYNWIYALRKEGGTICGILSI